MPSGRLIVLEGSEGVGKTTHVRRLADHLATVGVRARSVREPGGTPLGDEIRRLLLDPAGDVVPRAEALLFMASRAQLVERDIAPALAHGELVLADRFVLSTYAYQAAGRGIPLDELRAANALAAASVRPDVTLLLALPAADGLARAGARGDPDRIERTGGDFHARVTAAFAGFAHPAWQRAHPECGPIVVVDGRGSEDDVFGRVLGALATRWPETFRVPDGSHP